MTGEQVAAELRRSVGAPPPILLLSASTDLDGHAERIGAVGYVRKPFDLDELLAKVQSALPATAS